MGGILALTPAVIAALLAATGIGLPAASRALNPTPAGAWPERRTGTADERDWRYYC